MKILNILALTATLALPAALASAQQVQGLPILSDGQNALTLQNDQGIHKVSACGYVFHIRTQSVLSQYKSMKPRLDEGGYVYYHTTDSGKRFCACAWGRYEHLNGTLF